MRKWVDAVNDRPLLGVGIDGVAFAALCCFTPALLVLAGVVGLSAITGYLGYVLLPALLFFIGFTVHAVWRRQQRLMRS